MVGRWWADVGLVEVGALDQQGRVGFAAVGRSQIEEALFSLLLYISLESNDVAPMIKLLSYLGRTRAGTYSPSGLNPQTEPTCD